MAQRRRKCPFVNIFKYLLPAPQKILRIVNFKNDCYLIYSTGYSSVCTAFMWLILSFFLAEIPEKMRNTCFLPSGTFQTVVGQVIGMINARHQSGGHHEQTERIKFQSHLRSSSPSIVVIWAEESRLYPATATLEVTHYINTRHKLHISACTWVT
jgi:hypothetical protein